MKQFYILYGVIVLFIFSCNKDKKVQDDIVFVDVSPDIVLHPVDSVGSQLPGGCQDPIPFPADSTVSAEVDMNQDGIADYRFTYSTSFNWVSNSSPCANFNSQVQVSALVPGNKIAVESADVRNVKILSVNDLIDDQYVYSNDALIYRDAAMSYLFVGGFYGEGYIGVKLFNGGFGWIKIDFQRMTFTCMILEHACNRAKADIVAGQVN